MASNYSESEKNDGMVKELTIQLIKKKILQLQNTSQQTNEQLQSVTDEIINDIEEKEVFNEHVYKLFNNNCHDEIQDKVKTKNDGRLPDKQFTARNSLLTDLLEIKHIQTIYHMFLAIFIGLLVNTAVYDLLQKGKIKLGFELVFLSFANFNSLLFIWLCMFFTTISVYVALHFWAAIRIELQPKSKRLLIWDKLCLTIFIFYIPLFIYYCTSSTISYKLTIAESIATLGEMVRFVMKAYAFVRSNVPRAMSYKVHTEDSIACPEFSKYLYFLFAPTLIYQDSYPRTKQIRWKYVVTTFIEVLGCILYTSFIFERFLIPVFEDYGLKQYKWQDITLLILGNGMAGILVLLAMFYGILHAWMNCFAEMLRFGDRMFYKDWWTSTTYGRYYRTWNVVVHDWLYTYIYKDMYEIVCPTNKLPAKFLVFFVSALFHDFILGFSFRFCLPVQFILFFGFGVALSFLKCENSALGNSLVWYTLSAGMGIAMSAYCMEFYARLNCPIVAENTLLHYFIPRMFTCS